MAKLMLTDDEATVCDFVGTRTFTSARDHLERGDVSKLQREPREGHLFGVVRAPGHEPFVALAQISLDTQGRILDLRSNCTCGSIAPCAHAVALMLATLPDTPESGTPASGTRYGGRAGQGGDSAAEVAADPSRWELTLASVLGGPDRRVVPAAAATVGLQFERMVRTGRAGTPGVRIGIRPVMLSSSGNWVRTGISWSTLSYARIRHTATTALQLRLLHELHLLVSASQASRSSYYGYGDQPLYLDQFDSRRIWDALAEARDAGLKLLQPGKRAAEVVLHGPVEVEVTVRRAASGLDLSSRVSADGREVPMSAVELIGSPVNGLLWWHPEQVLRLAPVSASVSAQLQSALSLGSLHIPAPDEQSFLTGYYPQLRQRVPLSCPDGSVELPHAGPPSLSLTVDHREDHQVDLAWRWTYPFGTLTHTEPLWSEPEWSEPEWSEPEWSEPGRGSMRDLEAESVALKAVEAAVAGVPGLFESTVDGDRLAPHSRLSGMATVRLLAEVLPALTQLPDVIVTINGTSTVYRETAAEPVIAVSGAPADGDRDWFDLAVTISIEAEDVPFNALFVALAQDQSHLILPSGTYFKLDAEPFRRLARLIEESRALQDPPSDGVRLNRFQASLWDELDQLGVISGQALAWQQSVQALAKAPVVVAHPPPGLRAIMRPYQLAGYNWLATLYDNRLGGVLADDMGLGKTLQTLALFCHVREHDPDGAPFLVVAPTSVASNWAAEAAQFAPGLRVAVISETATRRGRDLAAIAAEADVVVTSYALFRIEKPAYDEISWAGLVLDEAQFAKNHQSRNYECAKTLAAPFKLAITGTPMENNLLELWSLLSITAPGLFSSPSRFTDYYRNPIEKEGNQERLAQLRRRIQPLMLRRNKNQVITDLPAKQEQVIELELNPRHKKLYQTYLNRERQKVLGLIGDLNKNRFEIFRSLTLLRQASLDVTLVDPKHHGVPSTKLDAMMDLVADVIAEGHRTLIFSQFTRFLTSARERLTAAGIESCYLDGSTRKRAAVLDQFRNGAAPVFLISLKAGGFGINLTEADYCILLDPWWNPATEAQAVDRVHRIGQTKNVMVYRLVAKDTIENKVMALKAAKSALFSSVMDDGGFESAALTADDIRGLLD